MEIPVFTVDAFAHLPFRGNPAAVCPLMHELSDELYQKIAAEMNLSETVFITRLDPSDSFTTGSKFSLRWFTPKTEVNMCGHATLASAAVLFQHKQNTNSTVVFETRSGDLSVSRQDRGYVMDFPLSPPTEQVKYVEAWSTNRSSVEGITVGKPETFYHSCYTNKVTHATECYSCNSLFVSNSSQDPNDFRDVIKEAVGTHPVQDVSLCSTTKNLLVRLADSCDRAVLTSLNVNPFTLESSERSGRVMGVIVTVKGSKDEQPGYDFLSRYFAPWYGVPEDPVTGSTHTVLGSYWSKKLDKKKMLAYQCSSRGGELQLEVRDDGRITMAGQTVTVLQGTITLQLPAHGKESD